MIGQYSKKNSLNLLVVAVEMLRKEEFAENLRQKLERQRTPVNCDCSRSWNRVGTEAGFFRYLIRC